MNAKRKVEENAHDDTKRPRTAAALADIIDLTVSSLDSPPPVKAPPRQNAFRLPPEPSKPSWQAASSQPLPSQPPRQQHHQQQSHQPPSQQISQQQQQQQQQMQRTLPHTWNVAPASSSRPSINVSPSSQLPLGHASSKNGVSASVAAKTAMPTPPLSAASVAAKKKEEVAQKLRMQREQAKTKAQAKPTSSSSSSSKSRPVSKRPTSVMPLLDRSLSDQDFASFIRRRDTAPKEPAESSKKLPSSSASTTSSSSGITSKSSAKDGAKPKRVGPFKRPKLRRTQNDSYSRWMSVRVPVFLESFLTWDFTQEDREFSGKKGGNASSNSNSKRNRHQQDHHRRQVHGKPVVGFAGSTVKAAPPAHATNMQGYGSDMVRINPSSLRDVPLSFRSSQEYAEVFLPLVLEDAFEEARASLRTGRIADRHCPWSARILPTKKKQPGGPSSRSSSTASGAAAHTRNEPSTENTSDRLKPVMLRFVLHKYTCKSKGEVSQHEQEFGRLPRYDLARVAEADYLKAHGMRKHRTVAPSELSQGDVLILSSSRKYYDNRGVRTRDLAPTAALAVVHGSSRVSFARTPHAQDPTGRSYEIECLVPVTLPVKAELPSFVYGWRPSNCITSWREYDAVAQVVSMNGAKYPLLETLLDGKGKLSQAEAAKQQQQAQQNATASGDEPADNVTVPGVDLSLLQYLESTYNPSQFKAIIKSAAKTKGFTLIQGPPGTGKTHTLLGIINLLHVSVFQRYYDSQLLSPHLEEEQIGNAAAPVVKSVPTSRLSEMDRLEQMPHILVTAPSNTAVDGMVEKIYSQQFRDGLGQMYIPAMVRIGKPTQGNHESASVYLDTQVEDLIRKLSSNPLQPLKERIQALELREKAILDDAPQFRHRAESLAKQIRQSKAASLKHLVWMENNKQKATMDQILEERHNEAIRLDQLPGMEADYRKFAQLFHTAREKLQACRLELSRCRTINSATSPASMRAKLRESVMEQAQIFFVTLSSSALRQIQELRTRFRFEVVVVDEAAQATEPSVLVPLQHHVDHCVLVGDPKQLPATVVSDRAASHYLQQSLFERLQTAGHPSYLLDTQYRCHPKISAFPSREFYAGRLKDGSNVLEPDYETPGIARFSVFNPLTFLNVSRARQSSSGDSFRNEDEAVLALNLYETLRFVLKKDELTGDVGIGIITPYREQLELLRSKFKDYRSDENLQLNTVDGFQGREFDVIILSCVRSSEVARHGPYGHASSSKAKRPSIGFVKDARRLNVAVTRAKFCLIVIGQDRTLRVSPLWARFLDHVHGTGSFLEVTDVHADLLHL